MTTVWQGVEGTLARSVLEQSRACLRVYKEDPSRVEEDAAIELTYAEGGYRRAQLLELVQNATDALRGAPGKIHLILTSRTLYVANEGAPFTEKGVDTILASHLSGKSVKDIGQFGLGFKSVLAVTNNPAIFSRSGSFAFHREWARQEITAAGLVAPRYPVLRLALPLDPTEEASRDSVLEELMGWASSVIRLPLSRGRKELQEDLEGFPARFLLFAPQVKELILEDREERWLRRVRLEGTAPRFNLIDGEQTTAWFVTSRTHRPSTAALADAGELVHRSEVDVSWAAPLDRKGRSTLGEFWAHFPTGLQTTLGGIVNAPWKMSADRLSMLDGMYNRELLVGVVPDLIRDSLPELMLDGDPASALDLLPARGREARSLGDDIINEPVYRTLAKAPSLPDRTGTLRLPARLTLQPRDLDNTWVAEWSPQDPSAWVHESVDSTPERRAKAERLITLGTGKTVTMVDWLEAMVAEPTPKTSGDAIRLAAQIVGSKSARSDEVRRANIVLLEDGDLGVPVRGHVFLRGRDSAPGHDFLHPRLMEQPGIEAALRTLGIEVLDRAGELRAALQRKPKEQQWRQVWDLIGTLDDETALALLGEELPGRLTDFVFARAKSGKWRNLGLLFLPGDVIPANTTSDADFLIDPTFHARHVHILERCGAVSAPRLVPGSTEPWLRAFRDVRAERYRQEASGPKPAMDNLDVRGPDIPWPLEQLPHLSLKSRAAMTESVLRLGVPSSWFVLHKTSRQFKPQSIPSPVVYRLYSDGVLQTTFGLAETQLCLHPDADVPDVFPKAEVSSAWAQLLKLPKDLSLWDASSWRGFIAQAESRRPEAIGTVYGMAARSGVPRPAQLVVQLTPNQSGKRAAESIAVTTESEVFRSLLLAGVPGLLVAAEADLRSLVEKWGIADGREMLKEQVVAVADSDPVLLLDRFPPLRLYDAQIPDLDALELQTCSSIEILVSTPQGQQTRPSEGHRDGNRLLVINGTETKLIQRISGVLKVPLNADNILGEMARQASSALALEVLSIDGILEKLVAAVGAEALRQHIPRTAIADLEAAGRPELTPLELAELVHSVHGYLVLQELRSELADAGLRPPSQWAGGRETRKYVESLGFPPEYAGFAKGSLAETVEVEGPVSLPDLHPYQAKVVDRIERLLTTPGDNRRGMVTLPTGAGKTRVAVESVVNLVATGRLSGPVMWISQTEELCEQAVQAWAYVWRAVGQGPMQITRFWAGREAKEVGAGTFQVLVCTIAKLTNAVGDPRYDWMRHPSLIIIDEAHGAIAPEYARVLNWLGESRSVTGLDTPLLGLTATAFRGNNEVETDRLVKRFGSNKLDQDVFGNEEPYQYLQRHQILARVRQKTLEGIAIDLSETEMAHLKQFSSLSRDRESAIGQNSERNGFILDSLIAHPEDWTTLLFATSVEHARALAAELSYYGVPARPIHSGTDVTLRRRYVEQFRAGEIRVLTNYSVLAMGFDAPKVQAVYVTRPTFSPNLYQQMIGRGLRGPLNGGSDEVLIVNVADNLVQYGDQLAFHHFDYLWSQDT